MEDQEMDRLIKGQKTVIDRLSSSFRNGRIGHAYMFDGNGELEKKQLHFFLQNFFFASTPRILFHVKHAGHVFESHQGIIRT